MKLMKSIYLPLLITLFFCQNAIALVDYSEESPSFTPKNSRAKRIPKRKSIASLPAPTKSSSGPSGMFELSTDYESINVQSDTAVGKVSKLNFDGYFETNYNLFLDLSFWTASSEQIAIADQSDYQKGNPVAKMGFNFFRHGAVSEMSSIDIFGGASFGAKNSNFATSRTDKIFGVTSSKRFMQFVFGMQYEYRITGAPKDSVEMGIGNMQLLSATLGWQVSRDISFFLEGGTVKIAGKNDADRELSLGEKVSFGYVNPELQLGISPSVQLSLGAIFRTKRLRQENIVAAKLWDVKGSYGSSIIAGLKLSI
jgi:hypothetical protein